MRHYTVEVQARLEGSIGAFSPRAVHHIESADGDRAALREEALRRTRAAGYEPQVTGTIFLEPVI